MLRPAIDHIRRQPVAYVALFFALAGTSFAAAPMVTGANVKNSSLTGADVKNGSLTGADIKAQSLKAANFAPGQLPAGPQGPIGRTGPGGPAGPAGATGANGANGANGATNVVMRSGGVVTVGANNFVRAEVSCAAGERATGGGVYNEEQVNSVYVTSSYPTPNPTTAPSTGNGATPTGWRVWVANKLATPYAVEAYVICAKP